MKVILFGATGMVGQGVLRECLHNDGIEGVLVIGRNGRQYRCPDCLHNNPWVGAQRDPAARHHANRCARVLQWASA